LPDSGFATSESIGVVRPTVKTPLRSPSFWMSTVPTEGVPAGLRLPAERIAVPSLELSIVSVPEANVFAGFADDAVKSAPEPTTAPAASRSVRRAPSAMRGWAARTLRRDRGMAPYLEWMPGRGAREYALFAGNRAISPVVETSGFASPPRDGFALCAALPSSASACLSMTNWTDVRF
jgi:hypothetical protein